MDIKLKEMNENQAKLPMIMTIVNKEIQIIGKICFGMSVNQVMTTPVVETLLPTTHKFEF